MGKRPNGDGGIRRLSRPGDQPGKPTGLWEARATLGWVDGRRVRRSFYGKTRSEAAAAMVAALAKAQTSAVVPSQRLTVEGYLRDWLDSAERRLRPSTATRYRGLLVGHAVPVIGRVKLTALEPRHVERMMTAAVASGLAPRTANHLRSALRAALSDGERQGLVVRNVAKLVAPQRIDDQGIEPMDFDEAKAILAAVKGTPLEAPVATALWLGLRQGELLGLRWRDIDKDFATVTVRGALQRHLGEWRWQEPKTRQSRRVIDIPAPLAPILRAHRESRAVVPLRAPGQGTDDGIPGDLVFTTARGEPVEGTGLTHRFHIALQNAGLRARRFHDLRHGTATLLLASGVDIKTVSAILGHATISITANIYASVLPSLRADAADRLARHLGTD